MIPKRPANQMKRNGQKMKAVEGEVEVEAKEQS
jgi:hypothetical protein